MKLRVFIALSALAIFSLWQAISGWWWLAVNITFTGYSAYVWFRYIQSLHSRSASKVRFEPGGKLAICHRDGGIELVQLTDRSLVGGDMMLLQYLPSKPTRWRRMLAINCLVLFPDQFSSAQWRELLLRYRVCQP